MLLSLRGKNQLACFDLEGFRRLESERSSSPKTRNQYASHEFLTNTNTDAAKGLSATDYACHHKLSVTAYPWWVSRSSFPAILAEWRLGRGNAWRTWHTNKRTRSTSKTGKINENYFTSFRYSRYMETNTVGNNLTPQIALHNTNFRHISLPLFKTNPNDEPE